MLTSESESHLWLLALITMAEERGSVVYAVVVGLWVYQVTSQCHPYAVVWWP